MKTYLCVEINGMGKKIGKLLMGLGTISDRLINYSSSIFLIEGGRLQLDEFSLFIGLFLYISK